MKILAVPFLILVLFITPTAPAPAEEKRDQKSPISGDLERFVPSEEVPADSAISFPVDI